MARSLREVMSSKSEDGLMDYLTNFDRYTPDAISVAVDELKRRGKNFTEEELNDIKTKIEIRKKAENEDDGPFVSNSWRKDIVTDPNAPLLYSKGAINIFSILFSVIFGAVLLSKNIDDRKKKWIVIGFGIIFTAFTILIVYPIPRNTSIVLMLNTAGGLGLTTTFWNKFIGKEVKYRAKPIWMPLIISIIITLPILLAIIYG